MAYPEPLTQFAQSVYLVAKNRYFDDIAGTDGQEFITQIIDWTNQLLDELENVTDAVGNPVTWNWMRQMDTEIGSVTAGENTVDLENDIQMASADQNRYIKILVNDVVMSTWQVVAPDQIDNRSNPHQGNLVTQAGGQLVFNRAFTSDEDGGTVVGDVVGSIPRLTATSSKALTIVKPKQLLVLGVAKNMTLPDIVQGGLSPSYVQKYNDLLQSSIVRNNLSSGSKTAIRDSYDYIGGVGR